ncbi:MAG: maturase [Chloroflexi bacterium]|nr:maturase [Chloroflexota bacterium]
MQKANHILQAIRKLGEQRLPLTRVYRCLFNPELYLMAYAKIYSNQGAMTPGTVNDTADGMSMERIEAVIAALRTERFYFRPSRRGYADKKNGGKRPLGLPDFTEKLVQEVLRMVLEAYYEPRFKESSHGFRTGRGCHTALTYLHHKFLPSKWFIEGDIRGCFDNIDHEVLLTILSRDIHDGRLLELIRKGLKAGVMEEWEYKPTCSGTPQGGIVSPILANIYLHELDTYIEEVLIPQYTRGDKRERSPEYREVSYKLDRARKRGDKEAARHLEQRMRSIPSKVTDDPGFRRLTYVRYADDFILGFAGTKTEAEAIKAAIGTFLRDTLHLELSSEKTLITHARDEHAKFLGYAVSIYHADHKTSRRKDSGTRQRSANGKVRLGVPYGLTTELARRYQRNGKPMSELSLLAFSDAHIIDTYQARFRGIAEYYKFAVDRTHLGSLKNVMQSALFRTLAHKYKISVREVYQKYRSTMTVDGQEYRTFQVKVPTQKGERTIHWGGIPLKVVKPSSQAVIVDALYREQWKDIRSDLIQRLQAEVCELCGTQGKCEVHHVRKLADLKQRYAGRREKPFWVTRMIAMQRKTLVVCHPCHVDIHAGRPIPKERNASRESRVI